MIERSRPITIEWVNHASFILEHDDVRLIVDPWIAGRAFDHGWEHLVPSTFAIEDFASISHIWLSHEHPDHFAPKNLAAIPPEVRARITMLYHRGVDHRIGTFCRNSRFKQVVELAPGEWRTLGDDLRVRSEDAGSGDSWLAVRTRSQAILNVNDAVLERRWRIRRIADMVGAPIDVLLTQFSYASWVGNPEDVTTRRKVAREHLERVGLQVETLKPKFVVPFASMVRFCHEENAYLNADMNTVEDAYRYIDHETGALPIAMYPGDRWVTDRPHDSEAALERYRPHYEREPVLVGSPSIALSELERQASRWVRLLRRNNPGWALTAARRLGLLKPARIFLWDHEQAVELSLDGLRSTVQPSDSCDVAMGSESLNYMLRFLWGGATVSINGRFRVPAGGEYRRFQRLVLIANYNNRGWSMLRYIPVALTRILDRAEGFTGRFSQRASG